MKGAYRLKFNTLVKSGMYILIGISVIFSILLYMQPMQIQFEALSNGFGAISLMISLAAVSIWIVRKVYVEVKKRKIPDFNLTKSTLTFLRKYHILLGWATMMTATGHGVYYLLIYPNRVDRIYTGLIAWTALALLMGFGALLDYRIQVKIRSKQIRMYHFTLAIIFIVAMVVHA